MKRTRVNQVEMLIKTNSLSKLQYLVTLEKSENLCKFFFIAKPALIVAFKLSYYMIRTPGFVLVIARLRVQLTINLTNGN